MDTKDKVANVMDDYREARRNQLVFKRENQQDEMRDGQLKMGKRNDRRYAFAMTAMAMDHKKNVKKATKKLNKELGKPAAMAHMQKMDSYLIAQIDKVYPEVAKKYPEATPLDNAVAKYKETRIKQINFEKADQVPSTTKAKLVAQMAKIGINRDVVKAKRDIELYCGQQKVSGRNKAVATIKKAESDVAKQVKQASKGSKDNIVLQALAGNSR